MTDEVDFDRQVRGVIAEALRSRGAIPTIDEIADELRRDSSEVDASFERMIAGRVFTPRRDSLEILAYNPFCAEPTDFKVTAADRAWWAICAWDALGIPSALDTSGAIDARCGDCAEPIRIDVQPSARVTAYVQTGGRWTATATAVMQVGVPARDFWKDIYRT